MTAVSVTAEHIARGTPGDGTDCAVWHAITDTFPGLAYLRVGYLDVEIRFRPHDDLLDIGLPPDALRPIRMLDVHGTAEPFTFELDYPAVAR